LSNALSALSLRERLCVARAESVLLEYVDVEADGAVSRAVVVVFDVPSALAGALAPSAPASAASAIASCARWIEWIFIGLFSCEDAPCAHAQSATPRFDRRAHTAVSAMAAIAR
jgi:hypothetical protein